MSPRFVLGRENVPCVAEVVNRSLKADCTDFNLYGQKPLFTSTKFFVIGNCDFFHQFLTKYSLNNNTLDLISAT